MDFYESYIDPPVTFVTTYKWTCLILGLGLWYLWTLVSPVFYRWKREKEDREWEAHLHRDPDAVVRRQEAMEQARLRMQQLYDEKAKVHAEKLKEKEERERENAVKEWDKHREGRGYRSRTKASVSQEAAADRAATEMTSAPSGGTCSRRLRPAYNPLMGQGGSRFTPAPRGGFGGG